MVAKKYKSKRVTLQRKYKIQKRTKEHQRKLNRGRLGSLGSGKKKADDNFIPNSWPYKEDLLKSIQASKDKMEEIRIRQKEKRAEEIRRKRLGIADTAASMEVVVDDIPMTDANSSDFVDINQDNVEDKTMHEKSLGQNSRRQYLRELRKVVEGADVILLVLDARDPAGTRSSAIEEMVLAHYKKKLVYVLNKSDLVPKEVLLGWLTYLRKLHPTIPFKCNTQSQKDHLGRASGKVGKQTESALHTSQAVGAEELLGLLKNYSRVGDAKSIISVGVVGFPNVGKSSLINSLLRTRAVGVSPTPGFTKMSQEVILDKNIRLVDCPGVVFADGDSAATSLRNCVNIEELEDVMTPIQAILEKCPQPYLMQLYSIPKFKAKDTMAFLALVAKATGRLKKGGIPNVDATARGILHDWNNGKIKYYCKPPKASSEGSGPGAMIVDSFSQELDMNDLQANDVAVLNAIDAQREENSSFVGIDALGDHIDIHIGDEEFGRNPPSKGLSNRVSFAAAVGSMNDDDDVGEEDNRSAKSLRSKTTSASTRLESLLDPEEVGSDSRKLQKKLKKKTSKIIRRQIKPDETSNGDYSFDEDFVYQ